jgi:autotransporter-associated beta strand protein
LQIGDNNTISSFSGTITDGGIGKTLALTKIGNGTLTLSGANTYIGATTISGGTLIVDGSLSNTAVTVQNGGKLQGSGTIIGGSVTIQSGGTLAPGNSIQSLPSGALTLEALATYAYETDKSVALTAAGDLTAVTGNLTITSTAILTLTELNTVPAASGTWVNGEKLTLISYTGTWNGGLFDYSGANGGSGGALADGSTFNYEGATWQFAYNDTVSPGDNFVGELPVGSKYVTMTVVPEPGAALIGSLGLLALLRRRRN